VHGVIELIEFSTYLTNSVVHSACSSLALRTVHSEEYLGLGACRQLEARVDVDQVLELIFIVVVSKWLNSPLKINTTLYLSHI